MLKPVALAVKVSRDNLAHSCLVYMEVNPSAQQGGQLFLRLG
jgi:hypothetical protein